MIDIKRCNFISGNILSISLGVKQIASFFDLAGKTTLSLIYDNEIIDSQYYKPPLYSLDNKKTFKNFDEFKSIIENKSNLFRVDLLFIDLWNLKEKEFYEYKVEIDKLKIDYFIISNKYYYKSSDDVNDYHIDIHTKTSSNDPSEWKSKVIITDKINNWKADLDDLIKSYIRNEKLDNLFGDL